MVRRLTLVAGSGSLPATVAEAVKESGGKLQILDLDGRGDLSGDKVLDTPLSDIGAILGAVVDFRSTHLVLAGGVRISDAQRSAISRELGGSGEVSDISLAVLFGAYFATRGVRLVGPHRIAPGLLASEGLIGGPKIGRKLMENVHGALRLARALGRLDLGQAVVVAGKRPVAGEDAAGTTSLMQRIGAIRSTGLIGDAEPLILAKALKPRQPKFVDLPAIGPDTVSGAAAAGIAVIAVEADRALVLEREIVRERAQALGVSVVGASVRHG